MNNLPDKLQKIVRDVDAMIDPRLKEIDDQILYNQNKVLQAFKDHQVAESDLLGTTGYGNNDEGRDKLDQIYAQIFKTEDALVRSQFVSGTHTLATAMAGNLVPGDELTYLTGMPYDTMQEVIGMAGDKRGSLAQYGVKFSYIPLKDGDVDYEQAPQFLAQHQPKMVVIQRSRGYDPRQSFTVQKIKKMIKMVKKASPKSIVFIDNCYGEFSEKHEPTEYGADLMAGSLIKNAGGGFAKIGGYIVGKKEYVENATFRLTAAGIGRDEGATLNNNRDFYQGLFMAPTTTGSAIKGAIYSAALLEKMGADVSPKWNEPRTDLIQAIIFNDPDKMIQFVQQIQANSPIDSFVSPVPSEQPGYEDKIIMAAGSFVEGSTVEFSADGPIRPPYVVYMQGGLTYAHVKLAITAAVRAIYFKD
ncbi:methionine gamma-lyase family protein [Lactobacillus rodentium]|uniref:Aluminum resistance protein n=1 Tax=Lactobacillus rodentium TaxID=947835 RepID=A0A2Z6TCH3_9LACO|nr:methionine gamma-lyase family protein [Lactobacillus rodentium]MCR1894148.1 methionine gamma-lyase family protein [Lactobacillus rodentium]GBG04445.1 aluminum resistance protein [Lactobacillus rodentium]